MADRGFYSTNNTITERWCKNENFGRRVWLVGSYALVKICAETCITNHIKIINISALSDKVQP